ncbi:putative phd-finger domain-containing protein [Rosellinia necatrix]|uniref:Putative phd-finger domain-containing protein n=1 Tax=Rosellinia necatrix TaxID=77044 RepID=A0A1W2TWZ0_ROSNE|nr:putative phd-finger domain-containing protein [Rosellinia necatrix]
MKDTQEEPLVSRLERQLASLEARFVELESKYKTASVWDAPSNVATTTTTTSVTINEQTKAPMEDNIPASRVKVIISKRDSEGVPIESEGELSTTKEEDTSKHAFVLKKIIYNKIFRKDNESEINITSPDLWDLLKTHLRWYPYHIFSDAPVTLSSPYEPIIFCWDKLLEVASSDGAVNDRRARDDLKLLLDTISGGHSGDEKLDKFFRIRGNYKNQEQETVQFDDLWTIFPPGTLVYGKPFQNEDQVFVVKDNNMTWPEWNDESREHYHWSLEAWSYDWKDGSFGRSSYILNFEHFEGHRPLTSLKYYPFEMHQDRELVTSKLIERGKKFQQYCKAKNEERMFDYDGDAVPEKKGFSGMKSDETSNQNDSRSLSESDFGFFRRFLSQHSQKNVIPTAASFHVNGRVMVDYASFYQYGSANGRNGSLSQSETGPECGCSDCQSNEALAERYRIRFDKMANNPNWEDEQYLLCPPRVLGYILAEKQWAQLQVSHLKAIPPVDTQNAWNSRLKLADDDSKDLLFDLVRCHVSSEAQSGKGGRQLSVDDLVPGKGKGLVILLYGPPGVGKSSTAETIAVAARKPLFSISVADVGTKAKHVESNLSKIFSLATYWKAILLIDEADVFLESRGRGGIVQSMDKNALVSVFLRVLEYYKGIMFLTTNQIAEFDIAIPSRIHIAIKYESLRQDQMEAIFRGFLDNLHKQNLVDNYNEIMSWLKEDVYAEGLDGRQIRNIITTALDLANADERFNRGNGKLGKSHIKKSFNNAKKFKRDFETQMQRYKDSQNKMIQ